MNAATLISALSASGVALRIGDQGTLKASGEQTALDRWLPEIRQHKAALLALLAANDPDPAKTHRLFSIARPNGEQFSLSRNPSATLAEIQADYPGCTVEVAPDPPPAAALTADDLAMAEALLDRWQEDDPDIRREWLDGLRDPARLAGMRAMAQSLGVTVGVTRSPDDRRTCQQCRNLARNGRCLAAGRGELPLTASQYEPFQDLLARCVGYLPTADDPDQRPGNKRYPGLHQRLWAMARAKS